MLYDVMVVCEVRKMYTVRADTPEEAAKAGRMSAYEDGYMEHKRVLTVDYGAGDRTITSIK